MIKSAIEAHPADPTSPAPSQHLFSDIPETAGKLSTIRAQTPVR
jgi:hypothetical protein